MTAFNKAWGIAKRDMIVEDSTSRKCGVCNHQLGDEDTETVSYASKENNMTYDWNWVCSGCGARYSMFGEFIPEIIDTSRVLE